jgi:hypothetical protein
MPLAAVADLDQLRHRDRVVVEAARAQPADRDDAFAVGGEPGDPRVARCVDLIGPGPSRSTHDSIVAARM